MRHRKFLADCGFIFETMELVPGESRIGNYLMVQQIGSGAFASVWVARHVITNLKVAIKIISKKSIESQDAKTRFNREIALLKQMRHPFIAEFFESTENETDHFLIMEFAENGNMLDFINTGTENDPELDMAFDYVSYLGTAEMSAEQIASEMYDIACSFSMQAGANQSWITISGLSENMPKAMEIVEGLLTGAQPDEAILANMKDDTMKSRADGKLSQGRNFGALQRYLMYGPEFIARTTLSNDALKALTSEQLLAKVRALMGKQHEVLYYGPQPEKELAATLTRCHKVEGELTPLEKKFTRPLLTDKNEVLLAQYDAKQLYYLQYSNRGEKFDLAADPVITLYNEYFGGSMNAIVFQEMREARGLAYTAQAWLSTPSYADGSYGYTAFIATQNDKMQQAIEAFDEIINDMPESEAAFQIAKESLISRLRTERTVRDQMLWSYISLRDMGLTEDRDKQIFEKVQTMTLDDVKAAQEKWVKGRPYVYAILGDIKDLDLNYLKTLGPIKTLSQEEIFGY